MPPDFFNNCVRNQMHLRTVASVIESEWCSLYSSMIGGPVAAEEFIWWTEKDLGFLAVAGAVVAQRYWALLSYRCLRPGDD